MESSVSWRLKHPCAYSPPSLGVIFLSVYFALHFEVWSIMSSKSRQELAVSGLIATRVRKQRPIGS